jgi:outer membrane protein assembly factor BamB
MDLNTQTILWNWEVKKKFYCYKMYLFSDNNLVVFDYYNKTLNMLDKTTGKLLHKTPCESDNNKMTVAGGQIFLTEEKSGLTCYNYAAGSGFKKKWNFKIEDSVYGGFNFFNDRIFIGVGNKVSDGGKPKNTRLLEKKKKSGTEIGVQKTKELLDYALLHDTKIFLFNKAGQVELVNII